MLFRNLTVILVLLLSLPPAALAIPKPEGKRSPNIVFILADDLGWTDLGCQGSKYYETPNLDRLAQEGLRFTDAHTNGPNCAPTRASLMSGQYGPRHGIYTVTSGERGLVEDRKLVPAPNVTRLPQSITTVAQALKDGGYRTGMFGKWHLGKGEFHPSKRGFDEAAVSEGRHFGFALDPPAEVPEGAYLADYLTERAVRFIRENRSKPFFLYLPHFGVHTPLQAKPELEKRFEAKQGVGGHEDPTYAAMIASVDESVGRVLATLDELKLSENTLVVFTSDNGGVGGYRAAGLRGGKDNTNNAPLRGGKGMLYEGGHRVPLIVRYPPLTKPATTCAEQVISIDFYPTFLELAGAKPGPSQVLDGKSLLPLLGNPKGVLGRDLFWHFPGYLEAGNSRTWRTTPAGAIRSGDWKLIEFFEDSHVELYNLKQDVGEKSDLAAGMPAKAAELRGKMAAWRKALNAPMPTPKAGG